MNKWITLLLLAFAFATPALAQEEHESFKKDEELKQAFISLDMSSFMQEPVNFICDTIDKTPKTAMALNTLMRTHILFPKNTTVKKASETNNGYVQTYGIYNKTDDALMYVRFTLNPISGKLEEVLVEKNR